MALAALGDLVVQSFVHPKIGVRYYVIDGDLPSRTEWSRIRAEGSGINIVSLPGRTPDLSAISDQLEWLTHLTINSSSCRDLELLRRATGLRWLSIGGVVRRGADLRGCAQLEYFGGPIDKFPGILDHPSLSQLSIDWADSEPSYTTARLTSLAVSNAPRLRGLPQFAHPESVRTLSIHRPRSFSLEGVESLTGLERLHLLNCKELRDVRGLVRLQSLRELVLEACPSIEKYPELEGVEAKVTVIGANPFVATFREAVRGKRRWTFPPGARFLPRD